MKLNYLLYVLPVLVLISMINIPAANAEVRLSQSNYEMGDFLLVGGYLKDDVTIKIEKAAQFADEVDFKKTYIAYFDGMYEFGLPITEELGYTSGVYDVTISYTDHTHTEKMGVDVPIPVFTLFAEKSVVYLNEYVYFHGIVMGLSPTDYSYSGNVLIQILDSNGNLLEDNWIDNRPYLDSGATATKSEFRAKINSDDLYQIPQQDQIHSDHPVLDDGYRIVIRTDPTIYKPFHAYTLKATYDGSVRTVDFMVIDYSSPHYSEADDPCVAERQNYEHMEDLHAQFVEAGNQVLAFKYEVRLANFDFSANCN